MVALSQQIIELYREIYEFRKARPACALIKTFKDALLHELGLPTQVIDCDIMDPSFSTTDELKDKFEGFSEMMED